MACSKALTLGAATAAPTYSRLSDPPALARLLCAGARGHWRPTGWEMTEHSQRSRALPRFGRGPGMTANAATGRRGTAQPPSLLLPLLLVAAASALLVVPAAARDEFLGCYKDEPAPNANHTLWKGFGQGFSRTLAECRWLATKDNFTLYGAEGGRGAIWLHAIAVYV